MTENIIVFSIITKHNIFRNGHDLKKMVAFLKDDCEDDYIMYAINKVLLLRLLSTYKVTNILVSFLQG